jgi:hypothetical protein
MRVVSSGSSRSLSDPATMNFDYSTLDLAFASRSDWEERQTVRDLPSLNREEQALYDDLRDNRLRMNLRLEQEKVGFRWVEAALRGLG